MKVKLPNSKKYANIFDSKALQNRSIGIGIFGMKIYHLATLACKCLSIGLTCRRGRRGRGIVSACHRGDWTKTLVI
jgi:hypothetical protein